MGSARKRGRPRAPTPAEMVARWDSSRLPAVGTSHGYAVVLKPDDASHALNWAGQFGRSSVRRGAPPRDGKAAPHEMFQLLPVEALYLVHKLGRLQVHRADDADPNAAPGEHADGAVPMTPEELWDEFTAFDPRFPVLYAAYNLLRERGFLPRDGMKYACDYVVYDGPVQAVHARFCVSVRSSEEEALPWRSVLNFNRIAGSVAKELVVATIEGMPSSLHTPITMHEVRFKRRIPGRERDRAAFYERKRQANEV